MRYRNSEMKIDQLVSYLNEEKINLSPAFQRGHVWTPKARRQLLRNIVLGRPIPAIFLYKEALGSKYTYNILDGKQRLESVILFIADGRNDVSIPKWSRYFYGPQHQKPAGFAIELGDGKQQTFAKLTDSVVRDFREYSIPTVEISLEDESSLDEIISLFVDINQQGAPVNRFDIVKAMYKGDPLMKSVFGLIAIEERRGQDVYYKPKKNEFTDVLKRLQVVDNVTAPNAKVDKMWEKLLEIVVFARSKEHRKPVAFLKDFITPNRTKQPRLSLPEIKTLRSTFRFLASLRGDLKESRILTDQTHSYTVVTGMLHHDLLNVHGEVGLRRKLKAFARLLDSDTTPADRKVAQRVRDYRELSAKQTTDVSRRSARERILAELLGLL
jgi:hypothetical protein